MSWPMRMAEHASGRGVRRLGEAQCLCLTAVLALLACSASHPLELSAAEAQPSPAAPSSLESQSPAPAAIPPRVRRTIQLVLFGSFPGQTIVDIETHVRSQLGRAAPHQ